MCDNKYEDIKIDKQYFDKLMQNPEEIKEEVKPKKKKNKKQKKKRATEIEPLVINNSLAEK